MPNKSYMKQKKGSDNGEFTSVAQMWQERYTKAQTNQEKLFKRFSEWYDMLYAVIDTATFAPWRSKVYIPIMATKCWNMVSKFVQQKPGFEVDVKDDGPESEEPALDATEREKLSDKVAKKLESDWDNPRFEEPMRDKLFSPLVDATVTGTGMAKVVWRTKKHVSKSHPLDEYDEVDYENDVVTTESVSYNDLEPVNIFNVFIAPAATSLQSAPWVIIREFKSWADLKAVNDASDTQIYKNLDSIKGTGAKSDKDARYNRSRNRLTNEEDPISADQTVDLIELFECYERSTNKICTYVATSSESTKKTQWLLIREQTNPYWHGRYPLVDFHIRKRPFQFWGEGIFETTQRLQAAANDIFNHYLDNWNLSVDGGIMIDETSRVNDFMVEPGFELVYSGEKPTQFKFPEPNPNQLTLVMTEIQKALEDSTISNFATGAPHSGLDKTQGTATGIIRLQEAANDIITFMRDNYQQSIKEITRMWLSNNRQFMTEEFETMSLQGNKKTLEKLTPVEMQFPMEVKVDDIDMQPVSKQEKRANFIEYQNSLISLQQSSLQQAQIDPSTPPVILDFAQLAQELGQAFSVKNFERFTLAAKAPAEQDMQGMSQEGEIPPEQQGDLTDLPDEGAPAQTEDLDAQIEQALMEQGIE